MILTPQQFKTTNKSQICKKRSFRVSKSKHFAPKGTWAVWACMLPSNLLCVHYVTILTYLCHLPQSIHRGFSTDLEWALVCIFLPSSPILIKYSKSKESKTLTCPRKTHSRVPPRACYSIVGHRFPQHVHFTSTFVVLLVIPIWSDRWNEKESLERKYK